MPKYAEEILAAVTELLQHPQGGAGVPGDEKGASQHRSGYGISAPMPGAGKDNLMEEKYHER